MIEHRRFLETKRQRLDRLIRLVDETLRAMGRGTRVDEKSMFGAFDEKQLEEYRKEATERWGRKAVDASYGRLNRLSKAEQGELSAKGGQIELDAAALTERDPADPAVLAVMERWWTHIDSSFYPVTTEIFRGLGEMYVADERFAAHYNAVKPGLAEFMRAAMNAYCEKIEQEGLAGK